MASGKAEVSIATNPDDVWKLIRDFGGLADYMPGIDSCTVDGDVRTVGMMGIEIKEQLRDLDDDTRRLTLQRDRVADGQPRVAPRHRSRSTPRATARTSRGPSTSSPTSCSPLFHGDLRRRGRRR